MKYCLQCVCFVVLVGCVAESQHPEPGLVKDDPGLPNLTVAWDHICIEDPHSLNEIYVSQDGALVASVETFCTNGQAEIQDPGTGLFLVDVYNTDSGRRGLGEVRVRQGAHAIGILYIQMSPPTKRPDWGSETTQSE